VECLRKRAKGHLTFNYSTRGRLAASSTTILTSGSIEVLDQCLKLDDQKMVMSCSRLALVPVARFDGQSIRSYPFTHPRRSKAMFPRHWITHLSITRIPSLDSAYGTDTLMDGESQCGDLSARSNIDKPIRSKITANISPVAAEMTSRIELSITRFRPSLQLSSTTIAPYRILWPMVYGISNL
jgi:hypothetical protein